MSDAFEIQLPAALKKPDTPDPFYPKMEPKWRKIRTVLAGTQAMRDAGEDFTPRFSQESEESYQRRLAKTHLTNVTADSIENATAKVFSKPITIDKGSSGEYIQWAEDVDRRGNDLNTFGSKHFYTSAADGVGYFLADSPSENSSDISVAEKSEKNIRPYLVFIDALSMIAFRRAMVKGAYVPVYIRYITTSTDFDNQGKAIDVKTVHEIKASSDVDAGYFRTYRKEDKGEWRVTHEGEYLFDQVTCAPISLGKMHEKNEDVITPPFLDLAETNIAHWNSQSDQINVLEHTRFAMYHFKGISLDKDDKGNPISPAFGPNTVVYSEPGDEHAEISAVSLPVAGIEQGWIALDRMVTEMKMMGLDPLTPSNSGALTASERIIDEKKTNSALANWAEQYAQALELAFQYMGLWEGIKDPTNIKLVINTEFGVTEREINEIKVLRDMNLSGQLSTETLLNETKRRKVFDADFDTEKELIKLTEERSDNFSLNYSPENTPSEQEDTDKHKGSVSLPNFNKAA